MQSTGDVFHFIILSNKSFNRIKDICTHQTPTYPCID